MTKRGLAMACYAGAMLCVALAFVAFSASHMWLIGGVLLLAVGLVALGASVSQLVHEIDDLTLSDRGQIDLLRSQLEEQKATIDQLADRLDIAIFICDARATILFANQKVSEMFRIAEPLQKSLLAVTLSHELEDLVRQAIATREPQGREMVFAYPIDRIARVKAWIRDAAQVQVFVSIYDVSDLRRLERIRQDFVANVSHELRTPLSIIRGRAEMMLDEPGEVEIRESSLTKIIAEVDRLAMITQDLMVLSMAESNPVRKQACDLVEVFRSAIAQIMPKADKKGLKITFEAPESLLASANRSQISQVAYNLLDNAIAYSFHGSIDVTLEEKEGQAIIQVADTGIGIASDHVERIFERFYRVDKARSRASGGTGLGLSIVKHIVEAHGGTVSVESSLNQGSTFVVVLPMSA